MTDVNGALAEYAALRQEIGERNQLASSLFIFQLTSVGAIFAFVLSKPEATPLLLVVPVSSYLLCTRHVMYTLSVRNISRYIRQELTKRVPGGLNWDEWYGSQPPLLSEPLFIHPNLLTFPGPTLVAIGWAGSYIVDNSYSPFVRSMLTAILALGVVLLIAQYRLTRHIWETRVIRSRRPYGRERSQASEP